MYTQIDGNSKERNLNEATTHHLDAEIPQRDAIGDFEGDELPDAVCGLPEQVLWAERGREQWWGRFVFVFSFWRG